eukprot:m.219485 g.219485  ORF g.219485 m.219485 type:complete len:340 (+) comp33293_c4_seq6:299-1318(+)
MSATSVATMWSGRNFWAVCFLSGFILPHVRANLCDEPEFVFGSNIESMNLPVPTCAKNETAQLVSISLYAVFGTASFDTNYAFGENSFTSDPSISYRREFTISASASAVCRCQSDFRALLLPAPRTCAALIPEFSLSATCVGGSCQYGYRAEFKCASNDLDCQTVDVSGCDPYLATTALPSPSNNVTSTTSSVNTIVIAVLVILGAIALTLGVAYSLKTYIRYRNVKGIAFQDSDDDVQMLSLASPDIVLGGHADDEEDNVWRGPGSSLVLPVPLFDQQTPQPLFPNGAYAQHKQDDATATLSAAPDLIDPITGNRLELTSPPGIDPPRFDPHTGLPLN